MHSAPRNVDHPSIQARFAADNLSGPSTNIDDSGGLSNLVQGGSTQVPPAAVVLQAALATNAVNKSGSDPSVLAFQQAYNFLNLGTPLATDGLWGPKTQAALTQALAVGNLTYDGTNPAPTPAPAPAPAPANLPTSQGSLQSLASAVSPSASPAAILAFQQAWNAQNRTPHLDEDSTYGPHTRAAAAAALGQTPAAPANPANPASPPNRAAPANPANPASPRTPGAPSAPSAGLSTPVKVAIGVGVAAGVTGLAAFLLSTKGEKARR
jgi:hypothetical protein